MTEITLIGNPILLETNFFTLTAACEVTEIPGNCFVEIPTNCIVSKISLNTIGLITPKTDLSEQCGLCVETSVIVAADDEAVTLSVYNYDQQSTFIAKNQPLAYLTFIKTVDNITVKVKPEQTVDFFGDVIDSDNDDDDEKHVSWNLTETIHIIDSDTEL